MNRPSLDIATCVGAGSGLGAGVDDAPFACRPPPVRAQAPHDQDERGTLHGRIRPSRRSAPAPTTDVSPAEPGPVEPDALHRVHSHGPAFQVIDTAWRADSRVLRV